MGRFYKTAKRNFVDNFIYQPPWEMAMAALSKKDKDVQNEVDTMEFFRNLPIDYWDYDKDRATAEQEKWTTQVNDLAKEYQKDIFNPEIKHKLHKLKRDLQKDMTSGNIYKLQEQAKRVREFEAKRNALKNAADREAHLKQLENYKNMDKKLHKNGAYDNLFQADEMYDSKNLIDSFAGSDFVKNMKPDDIKQIFDLSNGRYIIKKSVLDGGISARKFQDAYKAWFESDPSNRGYAKEREKYHGEKFFDENGNYVYDKEGYALHDALKGVGMLGYKKHHEDFTKSVDGIYLQNRRETFARQQASKTSSPLPTDISKNASVLWNKANSLIAIRENKLKEIAKKYNLDLQTLDIDRIIDWASKNNRPLFKKDLEKLKYDTKEGVRATYAPLRNYYSDKVIKKLQSDIKTYYATKGNNIKMMIDLNNGETTKFVSPEGLRGNIINGRIVKNAYIVKNSTLPVVVSKLFKDNYLQSTIRIEYEDAEEGERPHEYDGYTSMELFSPSSTVTSENVSLDRKPFNIETLK